MRPTADVGPISDVKAHAADVPEHLAADRERLLIAQGGEAESVLRKVLRFDRAPELTARLVLTDAVTCAPWSNHGS